MKRSLAYKLVFATFIVAVVAAGSAVWAGRPKPPGGGSGCPKDIVCADVWDPVVCADGVTYSNQCYADRACAPKPCTSAGGGPTEL